MDYRRLYIPGGCYFFTVVTEDRRPVLIDQIDRLRAAFRAVLEKDPWEIDAIVVLPDHLHTLWRLPEGDVDYSLRWMLIKRNFSSGLPAQARTRSKTSKREKGIWQRRFFEHAIRGEEDWRRHMDYIHYNPVKHGYVVHPAEWPYSSFRTMVAKGLYAADWTLGASPSLPAGSE